jgi:hypothetical protein
MTRENEKVVCGFRRQNRSRERVCVYIYIYIYIYIDTHTKSVQHVASIHAIDCDGVGHFAIMAGE